MSILLARHLANDADWVEFITSIPLWIRIVAITILCLGLIWSKTEKEK